MTFRRKNQQHRRRRCKAGLCSPLCSNVLDEGVGSLMNGASNQHAAS
jgi:hypothetical protein